MIYLIMCLSALFISCNSSECDIDCLEEHYQSLGIDDIYDVSVVYRSRGSEKNTSVYAIGTSKAICSPYFVEFNYYDNSVVSINDELRMNSCPRLIEKNILRKLVSFSVNSKINIYIIDDMGNMCIGQKKEYLRVRDKDMKIVGYEKVNANWYRKSGVPPQEPDDQ